MSQLSMIQQVDYNLKTLAYVIKGGQLPDKTTFVTDESCGQQVGFIVYEANSSIQRHFHKPIERIVVGLTEVLYILEGKCEIDFYDDDESFISSKELVKGDLIIIVAGGHGFRMIEHTVMFEVKQGPYGGQFEKVKF